MPVSFDYADESDPGPYPIPPNAPIEGGPTSSGDRHVLVVDRDACRLWELYSAYPQNGGTSWTAGSGATWDLRSNAMRPLGWTSGDAAGLPILPGLVRYDEVAAGEIDHAIRFTAPRTANAYVWPASHKAPTGGASDPPMGAWFRLKASFDISGFSAQNQVILRALKKHGMVLADNGSSWFMSGAPDPGWNDDDLQPAAHRPRLGLRGRRRLLAQGVVDLLRRERRRPHDDHDVAADDDHDHGAADHDHHDDDRPARLRPTWSPTPGSSPASRGGTPATTAPARPHLRRRPQRRVLGRDRAQEVDRRGGPRRLAERGGSSAAGAATGLGVGARRRRAAGHAADPGVPGLQGGPVRTAVVTGTGSLAAADRPSAPAAGSTSISLDVLVSLTSTLRAHVDDVCLRRL